jgi:glycine/D-amino acid oxidase-like deaminating enzyme
MKIKRLPKDPGPAGWNRLLPSPEPARVLGEEITADWLIIGAGFAGLAAARRLSQLRPDDRIVVLDATRVGDGPAGRNSGFMVDLPHDLTSENYGGKLDADLAQTQDNRQGITFAAHMAKDFGLSTEAFAQSGKINGAASIKGHQHNLDFAAHLKSMGEPHDMLDAAQMRNMTGADYYQSGLFTPGAALIQPAMFVRGVAEGLASDHVSIFENSPVTSLKRAGDWIATTPNGQVTAPKTILAVNGHLESFGHMAGRLMHVFTYASMTRNLTPQECAALGGDPNWGLTPADPLGTTVRRISGTGGDRIVIRNRFTYDPTMEVSDARITSVGRDHNKAFAVRFPMLGKVEMEYRWGGRLCLSLNNVQAIGQLDEALWSACCQNGLGTAKGTLAGMLAAEQATGHTSPALERTTKSDPPKRLPPKPIAKIGATIRLKWGEAKAGREL